MKFLLQTLILCMILCVHTNAQHTIQTVKKDTEWLDISPTTKLNAKEFVQNKKILSLSESHTLELVSTRESRNGYRQYRYRQTYKGIPIEGADYIVHEKNAHVKKVRDKTAKNINLKTQPTVNESTALQTALHHIGATRYAWQDENHEAQLKKVKADAHATFYPTANLVFFNPNTKSEEDYRLAYRFNIYATEPIRRAFVYIDANNGKKLAVHDIANFADKAVSGMTNYHDEVNFTAHKSGNKYIYKNEVGGGIEVLNSNNTEGYPNNEITEPDAYFDQDPTAVDVLWASEETYNYFSTVHQWKSFDNADMRIVSWIHYGENYPNAFWNDSWMTFGDGNGSTLLPYTSIDIVAHEFTHGITTFSSGLIYDGESGALSESFSDIFGEIIENKALHDRGGSDWIAGGDIVAIPGLRGSRNLANPKDPTMRNRQPDTYKGEFWYEGVADYGGAHTNNGVQNYWFYLLAFGGIGVNDNGFAYSMEGIGVEKAAQITFNNLISLSRYDGYAEARVGAIVAAEMLYGIGSDEALQTAKAWCAVGVGDCYKDDCRILDSLALVDVYHASNGQNWDITWNLNTPIDSWYGVTLDDLGCVSNLSLNNNNLTADIAPQIGNLRHLKELYLNNNKLISLIPATVGKLDSLEVFEAWGNTIGGALPSEIGDMTNLRILNLSSNNIVSPIPAEISHLDNLTHLLLNVNPLSGQIPAAFGNFNSLSYLDLSNCHFTGLIPTELGNLTNLTELILTNNRISGAVPVELSNLQTLDKLELGNNKFTFAGLESIAQAELLPTTLTFGTKTAGCSLQLRAIIICLSIHRADTVVK